MAEPTESPVPTGSNPCPACSFLNAPGRVYCEDCGAKLEIAPPSYLKNSPPLVPTLATPAARAKTGAPASSRRPRILSVNRGPTVLGRLKAAIGPVIYLAVAAVLGAALWPPANIPPPATQFDDRTVAEIRTRLAAVASHGSTVNAPWPRLNAYLATMLRPGQNSSPVSASFVRAFVQPQPGGFALTIEKRILHIPIYTAVNYRLVVRARSLSVEPTGARIGRLPLPTAAAPLAKMLSGNLGDALAPDLEILRHAQVVRLSPEDVLIDFARRP